jgi:hypothetical protein
MSRRTFAACALLVLARAVDRASLVTGAESTGSHLERQALDFRYAPEWWQTSICLPDDWQKTLVAKDGGLLYDYPGRYAGFKTKMTAGMGRPEWIRQELFSPRVPIVRTIKRSGSLELVEEAFAVAPRLEPEPAGTQPHPRRLRVTRLGSNTVLPGWAAPAVPCDPAFKSIAVGWNEPIRYRFRAGRAGKYTVVFGLCEGHHQAPGQRVLDLQIEGKTRQTIDMIAGKGHNIPAVFPFDATDENGDGWIDVAVAPAAGTPDTNTILNVLWVFEQGKAPPADELIAGKANDRALTYVTCGEEKAVQLDVERIGNKTGCMGWAHPSGPCDPAFRNIAVGWREPIRYRFAAEPEGRYTIVFGLCEGHHQSAGQRILDLQIEGKTRQTVDMVALKGQNLPAAFAFDAKDENGDGWIDVAVAAAKGSPDDNAILNALWVFDQGTAPPAADLVAGQSAMPPLARVDCYDETDAPGPPRHDILILRLVNRGKADVSAVPALTIESELGFSPDAGQRLVRLGGQTTLTSSEAFEVVERSDGRLVLNLPQIFVPSGQQAAIAFCVARGKGAKALPVRLADAEAYRARAEKFWNELNLPYGRIEVPDAAVQALVDSSIRNIYQAREIKKDLPAFQVGPTCYRGLWVVDGSFLMEAVTFLGRTDEARNGIQYLLSFQRPDGAIMIIDGHLKETGIALWAVTRHARLTDDKAWLSEVWPKVEKGFAYIRQLRKIASEKPDAPYAGLIPPGFSDGGLGGKYPEYTNVYWTMAGMRAAVEAAKWLGKTDQANDWQKEYDDFMATFRKAAARDMKSDAKGNRYLPIRMVDDEHVAPQKAQWAFLHAVFPGKVFAADDPLVQGNMAMLKAVEDEGLVFGTGWLSAGIWNYFGSFYGHAWLWFGQGQKAAEVLYAFANHASPLLCWREEQMPVGKGDQICGDMPHNWASAEFIRLVRHLLVLERGNELHLFEGLPPKWVAPNAVTRLKDIVTEFGPMSLELKVAADGKTARLHVDPPKRAQPAKIVIHLDGWSGRPGTEELPTARSVDREFICSDEQE